MMVRALHAAGLEVILDVVYNHTGEGSHLGPTLAFRGLDNAVYYRLLPGTGGALRGFHRLRQHAERPPPAGAEAGDGQPALLGHRDARRRLPLRPRAGDRPRDRQLRPVRRVLRRHSPGPDPVAGEADRRAVGSRPQRLPGRPLSGRLVGVERALSRRRAPLLAGRSRPASRARHACRRQQRPVPGRRTPADREHQLRHLPRRLHAARSGQLHAEAQRGQRRAQQRRRVEQPEHQRRRRRPDQRCRRRGRPPAPGAQLPGDAVRLAGRPDDLRRGRDGPDAARQQQRLLPGQRDQLGQLDADAGRTPAARVHAVADRRPPRPPGAASPPLLRRPRPQRRQGRASGTTRAAARCRRPHGARTPLSSACASRRRSSTSAPA